MTVIPHAMKYNLVNDLLLHFWNHQDEAVDLANVEIAFQNIYSEYTQKMSTHFMAKLAELREDADVTLNCQGEVIKAHSLILGIGYVCLTMLIQPNCCKFYATRVTNSVWAE